MRYEVWADGPEGPLPCGSYDTREEAVEVRDRLNADDERSIYVVVERQPAPAA